MINILIIDDHPLVQDGIKTMLQTVTSIDVIGACKSGGEALEFLATVEPDVILLDINLPDMDGLVLCEKIRERYAKVKIIGLTSINEVGMITGLLQRGGNGYLLKNMERAELLQAIEKVMAGNVYLSEDANVKVLEQYKSFDEGKAPVLTRREKEILLSLANGLSGPVIAKELVLSELTIQTHRKNLFRKFDVHNVQSLLKVARDLGFLK